MQYTFNYAKEYLYSFSTRRRVYKFQDIQVNLYTGTSAEKRPQFMQMVEDAKKHKFDLILTR